MLHWAVLTIEAWEGGGGGGGGEGGEVKEFAVYYIHQSDSMLPLFTHIDF